MEDIGLYEYNKNSLIGYGAFAVVYKGVRKSDHKTVAIKAVAKKNLAKSQNLLAKEIKILKELSDLQHENLVTLLECTDSQNSVFLVMEYCNGSDLADYLHAAQNRNPSRPLSEATMAHFLRQISAAMLALQAKDVVHRDLKPQNILLCHSGDSNNPPPLEITLKIADFGFARFLQDGKMAVTLCGSPMYMAPEVIMSLQYDRKADLWSIGTILYQCLTGRAPFQANTPQQLKHFYERNVELRPELKKYSFSKPLNDLLLKLLRKDPIHRITYEHFYEHPFVRPSSSSATGTAAAPASAAPASATSAPPTSAPPTSSSSSKTGAAGRWSSPISIPKDSFRTTGSGQSPLRPAGANKTPTSTAGALCYKPTGPAPVAATPADDADRTPPASPRQLPMEADHFGHVAVQVPAADSHTPTSGSPNRDDFVIISASPRQPTDGALEVVSPDETVGVVPSSAAVGRSPAGPGPVVPGRDVGSFELGKQSRESATPVTGTMTAGWSGSDAANGGSGSGGGGGPAAGGRASPGGGGVGGQKPGKIRRQSAGSSNSIASISPPSVLFNLGTPPRVVGGPSSVPATAVTVAGLTRTPSPLHVGALQSQMQPAVSSLPTTGAGTAGASTAGVYQFHQAPVTPNGLAAGPQQLVANRIGAGVQPQHHLQLLRHTRTLTCPDIAAYSGQDGSAVANFDAALAVDGRLWSQPRPSNSTVAFDQLCPTSNGTAVGMEGLRSRGNSVGAFLGSPPLMGTGQQLAPAVAGWPTYSPPSNNATPVFYTSPGTLGATSPVSFYEPSMIEVSQQQAPVTFEAAGLDEETIAPAKHKETLAQISFVQCAVDCLMQLARSRSAPLGSLEQRVSVNAAGGGAVHWPSERERALDQFVLYLRALHYLHVSSELARSQCELGNLQSSQSAFSVLQRMKDQYFECLKECRQLYPTVRQLIEGTVEGAAEANNAAGSANVGSDSNCNDGGVTARNWAGASRPTDSNNDDQMVPASAADAGPSPAGGPSLAADFGPSSTAAATTAPNELDVSVAIFDQGLSVKADRLIYEYAITQSQCAILDEQYMKNLHECFHRYQTAQILFHCLAQHADSKHSRDVLNRYKELVERRLFGLEQRGVVTASFTVPPTSAAQAASL